MKRIKLFILSSCCMIVFGSIFAGAAEFSYDAEECRDPFYPLVDKKGRILNEARSKGTTEDLHLEGILWDGENSSLAIINNDVFAAGERIGNFKILKIKQNSVILFGAGEECILRISEDGEEDK